MEEKEVRKRQIREILDWIRSLKISEDEAVFIAGDFNVEFGSPEYARFLEDVPLEIDYQKNEQIGGSFSAKVMSRVLRVRPLEVHSICFQMMGKITEYDSRFSST